MSSAEKGMGIVFHSGSYDHVHHGLSFALAALALGREVKLFFTYWALPYLREGNATSYTVDQKYEEIIEARIRNGHLQKIPDLISQGKAMGAKLYACTSSMALLNIARDELISEVDKAMGITTFLTETADYQLLVL